MSTPFDADAGAGQGRTPNATAQGGFVYQLGHEATGVVRQFADGDNHTISQTAALAGHVVRFVVTLRPPAEMPAGTAWTLTLALDGNVYVEHEIVPGAPTRVLEDIGLPCSAGGSPEVSATLTFSAPTPDPYAVELPGVALDAGVEDTSDHRPGVINRIPEPGWTKVGLADPIVFDVYDTDVDGPDLNRIVVIVDGITVFKEGVFLPDSPYGFDTSSTVAAVAGDATVQRFTLVHDNPFESESEHTVRVVGAVVGGPDNALDTSWTFTTVDTTAPRVTLAEALDQTHVRVAFDEAMTQADPASADDTLNPSNYAITLIAGAPAVTPAIVEVLANAAGTSAILVLEDPLTDGATYQVTVSNALDVSGNLIDPAHDSADFTPAICKPPTGRDASLWNRIPLFNRDQDTAGTGDLRRFIACLEVVYRELLCDIDHWTEILDVDLAPEPFVDAMLADMGNPFEQFVLDLNDKRRLVKLLPVLFGLKGTDPAIIDAINLFVGVTTTITVPAADGIWALGQSTLGVTTVLGTDDLKTIYSFDVNAPVPLTEAQRAAIRQIAAYLRRAPTHLRRINEPAPPPEIPDHWALGLSHLGTETLLH